ncbi:MAG: hypothetical protein HQK86_15140 [Nitrospinae bacterium]|nr:hypothetical protein [Nitrospinota bacterium]
MSTYAQQMQKIFAQYEKEVTSEPANLRVVGRWAMKKKLWQPHEENILAQFANDMANALREEYRTDSNGRRYRSKHAVRDIENGKQISFWADIDKAPRSHMERAFSQRRKQIVGDCYQLKNDVDHFNEKRGEEPIQIVLDFTDDVEEMLFIDGLKQTA